MRRALTRLLPVILLASCGGGESPSAPPSGEGPERSAEAPSVPQVEMPPSTLTKTVSNAAPASVPSGNLRGDAASGRKLYLQYCASCHGEDGKGEGPVGRALQPKPADHTDSAYMGQLSDEHLFKVIQQGGAAVGKSPMMAPWGEVIPEPGIRDLIAYLRELSAT